MLVAFVVGLRALARQSKRKDRREKGVHAGNQLSKIGPTSSPVELNAIMPRKRRRGGLRSDIN